MKLFRYLRVYSYGDCAEDYLISARTLDEAMEKMRKLKIKNGDKNPKIDFGSFSEVEFENEIAKIGD